MTTEDKDLPGMTTLGKIAGTVALALFGAALVAGFLTDALDLWESGGVRGLRVALIVAFALAVAIWSIDFVRAVVRVMRLDERDS